MADKQNAQPTPETEQNPGLQIMMQYVRDLSFENPGAPNFATGQNPEVGVNANVSARKLSDTDYEVGLKFRIKATQKTGEDETAQFITELEYCGVFRLLNIPETDVKPVLLIEAPRQLFPFARRVLADATRDGGYPPIMLDPIDWVMLYRKSEAQAAQAQKAEAQAQKAEPQAQAAEAGAQEAEAEEQNAKRKKPNSKSKSKTRKTD